MARHASRLRWMTDVILLYSLTRAGALFRLDQIAPLGVAIETFLPQPIERKHDLAPIAAAHRRHQVLEELWAVGQGRLDRDEALAGVARRTGHAGLDPRIGAERPGQVEPGLGAGPAAPTHPSPACGGG